MIRIFGRAQQMLDTAASQQVSRVLFVAGALETAEAAELAACSSTYEATSTFMTENKSIQNMVHALSSLAEYAALRGVTITLEDFDGFLQPFARTYPLLWFMEHVPGLRYTLDIGNFAFSDEDVSYAAWLLKDYIVHVHCKDRAESPLVHGRFCRGLGQTPAGTGYLPMAKASYRFRSVRLRRLSRHRAFRCAGSVIVHRTVRSVSAPVGFRIIPPLS